MTARPEPRLRPEIVDADDLPALRLALIAALEGTGPPVLPVAAADHGRVLRMLAAVMSPGAAEPTSNAGRHDGNVGAATGSRPALVMPTSGSTGSPKLVVLSAEALTASARATHRRLGGDGQWLLSLPTSGIAGLQVITRSLLAGATPVVVNPSARPGEVAEAAKDMDGRRYAALVPTQLHRLLAAPGGTDALAGFDAVLIGGAAAPPALLATARDLGVRVVTTYGMTETAGGCVYDGRPLDGVAVCVDTDGRIRIGGPTVFTGYLGRPIETAAALSQGWFTTADRGRIEEDGLINILGRVDDVVVSGGVNVALPEVSERLLAHPDITDAVAVGVPDDEWGTAVVAFVVVEPASPDADGASVRGASDPDATGRGDIGEDVWRTWVAAGLGRAHAPRRVTAIASIPMLSNGKPDRQALQRRARELLSGHDARRD